MSELSEMIWIELPVRWASWSVCFRESKAAFIGK